MAMLWHYHKNRQNKIQAVNAPAGQTQGELEAALNVEEVAVTVEKTVPTTAKSSSGRNTKSSSTHQEADVSTSDYLEKA